jgi:hypothetical protein
MSGQASICPIAAHKLGTFRGLQSLPELQRWCRRQARENSELTNVWRACRWHRIACDWKANRMKAPSTQGSRSIFGKFHWEYWIYLFAGLEIIIAGGFFYAH